MPTEQSNRASVPSIPERLRLPMRFDAARLQQDLAQLSPGDWVPHFNKGYYQGEWSGVALRAIGANLGNDRQRNIFGADASQRGCNRTPSIDCHSMLLYEKNVNALSATRR